MSLEEKGAAMSKKNWSNLLSLLAWTGLAFVFVFGQTARAAQVQNGKGKPGLSTTANSPQAQANLSVATATKPRSAEEETETPATENHSSQENPHRGGQQEGIKVHGHWTIEVRNPDGALVSHHEFENSLQGGPGGGAILLSSVLSRQNTVGSWVIFLSASFDGDSIIIDEAGTNSASQHASMCAVNLTTSSCSANLTVTASADGSFTLAGSAVVPQTTFTAVSAVRTAASVCLSNTSPLACPPMFGSNGYGVTNRNLDGLNGDPAPVPVTPGQTVAVTVKISFS
jgi:hypothetical protein